MVLTLLISTILYVLIAAIAVSAVSVDRLSSASAPLSLVFREVAGINPLIISLIAIVATLNTILAQMTMSARVIYGMARHGDLPRSCRTGASMDGDTALGNRPYRDLGHRVGAVRST